MKLLYFAALREKIGLAEEDVTPPTGIRDVDALIAWLETRGPGYAAAFADRPRIRVAIDQNHVLLDASLKDAGEIAFFPPVTGG